LPRTEGHRRGVESVRTILECCRQWGVKYATLYAFSTENWKRPDDEKNVLFSLLVEYLAREMDRFVRDDIRLHVIGDPEALPSPAREQLQASLAKTAACDTWHVLLALNYGGRDEIVRAVRRLQADPQAPTGNRLDETAFANYLDTAGIPDPELMVRTSGELRLSNFLLWQLAYAEFVFVDECWPDFDDAAFRAALETFARRNRRFGFTDAQLGRTA
jgi:undecaprenyl diphosphate synthase